MHLLSCKRNIIIGREKIFIVHGHKNCLRGTIAPCEMWRARVVLYVMNNI